MKQVRGRHPWKADQNHLGISRGLMSAVLGADYVTPRAAPKPQPKKGPAPANAPRRSSAPPKEPDAVILEIRRLSEQLGMAPSKIRLHLAAMGHALENSRICNVVNYTTRSHLVPTPGAQPYITGEQQCTTSTSSIV